MPSSKGQTTPRKSSKRVVVTDAKPDPVYPKRDDVARAMDKKLRADTGALKSTDPLVSFLYHILRDELPAGVVEGLVIKAVRNADALYSNGFLLQYAENIAARLTAAQPTTKKGA